ncbi:autotransporter domain-containing protein [Devosia sp. CAU 1758]
MTERAFGIRKQRNEGRWLLAGILMATTAMIMTPKAEAQDAGVTLWDWSIVGVSGDGRTYLGNGPTSAYIANINGDELQLPDPVGVMMEARAINRTGNVVVGQFFDGSSARAFRFVGDTSGGVTTDLGTLTPLIGSASSRAHGVADSGGRVVGEAAWQGNQRGFVWIEGATGGVAGNEQMYALDGLSGGYDRTGALGISGDGAYAVGWSDGAGFARQAARWDLSSLGAGGAASVENLGSLTGMVGYSFARSVSGDGSVVVGEAEDADGRTRAFRWREGATNGVSDNVQMLDLGDLGGQSATAEAVSRDGRWVVGMAETEDAYDHAFRWSEDAGMESVAAWLDRHGVSTAGYVLQTAKGISDDGNVVVGHMYGEHREGGGYLARAVSGSGGGLMNIEEYHQTLYSAAGIANTGEFLTWLPMNGAHHRPLTLTPDLSGDMCAWATGDFAHHGASSTGLALAEIGACTDLAGGNVRVGGAMGTTGSWQDLALGGSARMQGQYVLSEIDWQPDGTPLLLSLTGMLGTYKANIDRAYSNGAATAISSGETNAFGGVVRLRADWLEAAVIGNTSINPYASLGFGGMRVNGYSESGGPFPAVFNAQTTSHADIRLGVTAVTELSAQTKLSTTLEVAHRTGTAAAATGTVSGLFDFSLGGGSYSQTWARVGAELDHSLNDNLSLSTSIHLASNGRDPSITASAGIKGAF